MKRNLLLFFVLTIVFQAKGQSSLYQNSVDKAFDDAFELFHKKQFAASKFNFEYLKEKPLEDAQKVDVEFYHAASALLIENPDGPSLLADFIEKYSGEAKVSDAAFILGDHFFAERNYRKAIENYRLVNTVTSDEQRADVLFKTGYSFFQLQDYKSALVYFEQVKRIQSTYLPDAYYYAGYIAMQNGDIDKAVADFKEAGKSRTYSNKVPYMLAALYYRQGDFQGLEDYATPLLNSQAVLERKEEIYLLLAEASYANKRYDNAANYYDASLKARKASLSRDQKYKAGVSFYETGNFQKASDFFKEVALENDKLGQVSSYYLGHAYLKLNNPQFASNSFNAAYKSAEDPEIREEALFNYAKVNLERGSFQDAVTALDSYLESYPRGTHVRDAENLLSEALINTNNYLRAIEHIEKLKNKSDRIKAAYQKVTFYQGITYYRDGRYSQALNYFDKSLTFPINKSILVQSHFWKGETHALNNNLPDAIKVYESVLASRPDSSDPYLLKTHYGLASTYFNSDQYSKAEVQYKTYTDKLQGKPNKENRS